MSTGQRRAARRAVIVGSGIAGVSAAEGLRAAGWDGEVVIIGDEPELPYRRPPLSKEVLVGSQSLDDVRIKKTEWYAAASVELVTGRSVAGVDPGARRVWLGDGERLDYEVLLLATGGRARGLGGALGGSSEGGTSSGVVGSSGNPATPEPGVAGRGADEVGSAGPAAADPQARVLTLRTAADAAVVGERIAREGSVVIVGAGLIGSEIAASATGLGASVTLLETADLPLPKLLPALVGERYARLHKERGVDLQTGVAIASVTETPSAATVLAADGRSWTAPLVIVAVGMEPRVELARSAGIAVDAGRVGGIVVDELGRTSAPGVFAAGDVANLPGTGPHGVGTRHRVEHWQHAQRHGLAVGRAMAGVVDHFTEVPWCWSAQYGLSLQSTGWPGAMGGAGIEHVVRGSVDELDFTVLALAGGRPVGAVGIGRPGEIRTIRAWIAEGVSVDAAAAADAGTDLSDSVTR